MYLHQSAAAAIAELSTIQDILRWSVSRMNESDLYFGHGTDNAWDEARLLVTHGLALSWDLAPEWYSARLTRQEREAAVGLVVERIESRLPAPYLTGEAWFCGLPFVVDERVLIPRSPIAELIQQDFLPWWQGAAKPQRILDLCTGSGCIGIACAVQFPEAEVELLDISFDALSLAEANIHRHGLSHQVQALQSDLFDAAHGQYDLIVSNPPYVDAEDMASLPEEFHHEPELALAAGEDGLDLVRIMLRQARQYLSDDGLLVVEVGNSWPALEDAFPELPFVWPDFERGGHGVFVLQARDLDPFVEPPVRPVN
ncbi:MULTISPECIES: 50S ribosomal protein L3 N(5)-glutamine methyltransferase [unclassified Oceanobacter]|jgi:ribosomal protein L3 glutamine methyltransferase|uniref:50S ribosomal protein L3 N(5)-glutamine methyltransferase n=1 Tax=unclassified Oceanobacter TaxID=2620260 RepID=UPI0026E1399E|nr:MULTISPECIES: 50S ribosomal protein L3 N(5)-glutamine methyltransferase [unclassified Oceanobacter]MDO6683019.1 50S ribosomal protein L3 N(5)-glutamine methyltransferase [Oceanobacter sp. 5_MG-2023]MDP2507031.1 50S ribosomal protein L3 N(5)-glutamine methyltransferase [Oceanobacter sp. 3_MG-2023]MDP2548143.1 50S ribosomal protein L3 N(5)-glutamine methyltransferase [Oceanobacter sp. 4_MG-2023]MDP2609552.1 50S ribosomal protein L3 N(5)-glutamine methyltransferase [Oceanobacter sp. 1_MG-2023]